MKNIIYRRIIFIMLIICAGEILAQSISASNTKPNLKKSLIESSPIYILNGTSPEAITSDNKDIICVSTSLNQLSLLNTVKIDTNGNILWNKNQIRISSVQLGDGENPDVHILPRSDGGAYFVYNHFEFRFFFDGTNFYVVYPHIQYVDATGNVMWGPTGKRLTNMVIDYLGGAEMKHVSFAPDGDILVYWTWFNDHQKSGVSNEFGTFVQKVNPLTGELKFGESGKRLFNFRASPIIESPNGNIYMFQDPYTFQNGGDSVACFNSMAEKQWQLPLLAGIGDNTPLLDINNYEELIIIYSTDQGTKARLFDANGSTVWYDKILYTSPNWIYYNSSIQRWGLDHWVFISLDHAFCVDRSGINIWGDSGIKFPGRISSACAVDDESIFISYSKSNQNGKYDLYLQKVIIKGNMIWKSDGIKIFENFLSNCNILQDKKGGAYLIFDAYGGYDPQYPLSGTYFQKIDKDGNLGTITSVNNLESINNISSISSVACYPNPSNGMQSFSIKMKSGDRVSEMIVYDILGREVRKLNIANQSGKEISVRWDGKNNNGINTAPGVYFYYMKTKNNINLSGKLLRIR